MRFRYRVLSIRTITVLILAGLGGLLWVKSRSEQPDAPTGPPGGDAFIGISTEIASSLAGSANNIFWSSPSHEGGLKLQTPAVYNPAIHRVGDRFAIPGENAMLILDSDLNIVSELEVPELGVGILSSSSGSGNGEYAAFSFNVGNASSNQPDARRLIVTSETSAHSIGRPNLVQSVTSCDDGSARWIEYVPEDVNDPLGDGTAYIGSWSPGTEVTVSKIDAEFQVAPSDETSLSCAGTISFVDAPTKEGDRYVLEVQTENDRTSILRKMQLPPFPVSDGSRSIYTTGSKLFVVSADGKLAKVDLARQEVEYIEAVPVSGPGVLSASFDGDVVNLIVRPTELDNRQSLVQVRLDEPACFFDPLPLNGYDAVPEDNSMALGVSSYKATMSALAVQKEFILPCSPARDGG